MRIRQHGDGTALVVARTDAADAHRLDHALSQLAGQLALAGHTDEFDVLRAAALGVLARPEHATALLAGPDAPGVEPGQTCPDNLGPLSRRVHNAKTHAGWRVEQPRPGVFLWTSPLGYRYRVDPDGSHELPRLDVSHSAVRMDLVWPGAA